VGLRRRVRNLERAAGHFLEAFTLPDGKVVRYSPPEMLDALAASLRRREHPLLSSVREADTHEGMTGLIRRLEESRACVECDEEPPK
jgi:hypothetical protein